MWPWSNPWTSLSLAFLIGKIGRVIVSQRMIGTFQWDNLEKLIIGSGSHWHSRVVIIIHRGLHGDWGWGAQIFTAQVRMQLSRHLYFAYASSFVQTFTLTPLWKEQRPINTCRMYISPIDFQLSEDFLNTWLWGRPRYHLTPMVLLQTGPLMGQLQDMRRGMRVVEGTFGAAAFYQLIEKYFSILTTG